MQFPKRDSDINTHTVWRGSTQKSQIMAYSGEDFWANMVADDIS